MNQKIKWGIIGLGKIAHKFVQDLLLVEDALLCAVASRNLEKASEFQGKYKALKAYGSYEELFEDEEIQIVYIATPHHSHAELTIRALESGKSVLCEKPIALNKVQSQKMIDASRKNNRFFMEAFWSRFNPSVTEVIEKVNAGEIGKVKYINADFSFYVEEQPGRMFDLNLAGGALLDMGVYPVFLSYALLGVPNKIQATSIKHSSGVDYQTAMMLTYDSAIAALFTSFASQSNMIATVSGERGRFNLNPVWHETSSYSYFKNNSNKEHKSEKPLTGFGFYYEILECHKCIKNETIESKLWSHQNSLELISIIDEIRAQIDLKYPGE